MRDETLDFFLHVAEQLRKLEDEIKSLTKERDAYKRKYEELKERKYEAIQ